MSPGSPGLWEGGRVLGGPQRSTVFVEEAPHTAPRSEDRPGKENHRTVKSLSLSLAALHHFCVLTTKPFRQAQVPGLVIPDRRQT